MDANFLPAGSLEALGILLRIFTAGLGKETAGDVTWVAVGGSGGAVGATAEGGLGTGLAGGWRDPGQRARTGPCCLINPAEVSEIGQRQIEQDDLGTASKLAPITRAAIFINKGIIIIR